MIDNALRALILTHAAAAGIGERVMPSSEIGLVARDLPKVAYTLIGAPRTLCNDGPVGIVPARYQLDIFAATLAQARAIGAAIAAGMHGLAGVTVDTTKIDLITVEDGSTGSAPAASGANATTPRFQQDVTIVYRE